MSMDKSAVQTRPFGWEIEHKYINTVRSHISVRYGIEYDTLKG